MTKQYVLITGGTKGIGRAIADIFASKSFIPVLTYSSDEESAIIVQKEIEQKYHVRPIIVHSDASNMEDIDKLSDFIKSEGIILSTVVINAGMTNRKPFEEIVYEEWDKVMKCNIYSPIFLIQNLLNNIKKEGSIIFTGSMMVDFPHSMSLSYGVSKAAVHAMVKNLVKFLLPYEIRVNGVAPGFVDTNWQRQKPEEIRDSIKEKIGSKRFIDPEEVAEVYFMISQNKAFNGDIIPIYGSYLCQ